MMKINMLFLMILVNFAATNKICGMDKMSNICIKLAAGTILSNLDEESPAYLNGRLTWFGKSFVSAIPDFLLVIDSKKFDIPGIKILTNVLILEHEIQLLGKIIRNVIKGNDNTELSSKMAKQVMFTFMFYGWQQCLQLFAAPYLAHINNVTEYNG